MDNLKARIQETPYFDILKEIGQVAGQLGIEAYAVGGFVRDLFLRRQTTDLDFVCIGQDNGVNLAHAVSDALGGQTAHLYPNFGTAAIRVTFSDDPEAFVVLEFVGARKESYRRDSRKPIVEAGTLQEDQQRRDFTINAMGIHLDSARFGDVIDPFEGRADLETGTLRTPLDPLKTFEDDPLRMIRAARFAAQLGFEIHADTFAGMEAKAKRVSILTQERITEELQKIMRSDKPSVGFRHLFVAGILHHLFPELVALSGIEEVNGQRHKDNFYHTLEVVDNLVELTHQRPAEDTLWLRWGALLHDIAKPRTKRFSRGSGWTFHGHEDRGGRMVPKIFRKLKLPLDERMRYVQKLVKLHHRPVALVDDQVTDSAVRRLLFEAGNDIEDLMTLVRADITSKNPRRVRRYLKGFDLVDQKLVEVEEKDRLRNFQPPVDGKEIMEVLNLKPGRVVGTLKEAVREAILEGEIPNEHEAAFAYLMSIKDEILARESAA
ncbi:MAG: HD domain-containing protein [Bacteroidota bacterium]